MRWVDGSVDVGAFRGFAYAVETVDFEVGCEGESGFERV